jgi:hypothetical protein
MFRNRMQGSGDHLCGRPYRNSTCPSLGSRPCSHSIRPLDLLKFSRPDCYFKTPPGLPSVHPTPISVTTAAAAKYHVTIPREGCRHLPLMTGRRHLICLTNPNSVSVPNISRFLVTYPECAVNAVWPQPKSWKGNETYSVSVFIAAIDMARIGTSRSKKIKHSQEEGHGSKFATVMVYAETRVGRES